MRTSAGAPRARSIAWRPNRRTCCISYSGALRTWDHKLQHAGLSMPRPEGGEYPELPSTSDLSSTESFTEVLDVSSVMKASQAISSELHFPQLAANLIDILMESTGAQRGVLVLQREEDFFVEASGEMGGGSAPLVPVQRMAHSDALCQTIAELVLSTGTHLLLDDASAQEPFRGEAYISRHSVRSVLCVPILHRKQLLGLVYLENNLIAGAFNANRLKAVGMLLAQAAISIENAGPLPQARGVQPHPRASRPGAHGAAPLQERRAAARAWRASRPCRRRSSPRRSSPRSARSPRASPTS